MLRQHAPRHVNDTLALRLADALGPDYALEHELGGGGMSRVFVATERALGRRVVVKVLPPDLAAGVNMERFRREIQLAAQLQHPHVVPLLTAGERGDLLWFTMPFIEGESLRALLDRRGRLTPREVLRILHDVVDALAYAHGRGVVHRDIKPGNILMSGSHAVVTDFGVAKALSVAMPIAGHTTSGMAIGTPAYMAPEQLAADPAADHRVDIYAVGLLAYELLTGTSPFSGTSPQATLAAQLTVRPTAPHIAHPDVPGPLSDVVMHCLEKDAARRPASAPALLEALDEAESLLSGEIISRRSTRRQRGLLVAVVALLVTSSVFALSRSRSGTGTTTGPSDSVAGAVVPETVVFYRDVPVGSDAETGIPLQVVLTPEESLAIARSFRDRASASAAVNRDSLVAAISRVFADSMERALARMETALENLPRQQQLQRIVTGVPDSTRRGGPPAPPGGMPLIPPPDEGTRRLAIVTFSNRTRDPQYDAFGRTLLDSVEAALRGTRGRLEIISSDVTRRLLGDAPGRATGVGFATRANFVLGGTYFVRGDSLVVVSVLTDVQGGAETRAHEVIVPLAEQARALPASTAWIRARLDTLRREDFRRSRDAGSVRDGPGGPGGPGGQGGPNGSGRPERREEPPAPPQPG